MEFSELPEEARQAALDALRGMLAERGIGYMETTDIEPARSLARAVKAAFTELYSLDS